MYLKSILYTPVTILLGFAISLLSFQNKAQGHPLGNFTLNHYSTLEIQPAEIIAHHVLDFAEIPSYNELANLDTDGDNRVTSLEMEAYKDSLESRYFSRFSYSLAEGEREPVALSPEWSRRDVILSQGQGALTCLQLQFSCALRHPALLQEGRKRVLFRDDNETYIRGIREIRLKIHPGVEIRLENILGQESTPVLLDTDLFYMEGLEIEAAFNITEVQPVVPQRTAVNIYSLIDPRSIPIYPLSPDLDGIYKIVKSPIQPNAEVQKQISMLQPRQIVSATELLTGSMSGGKSAESGTQPVSSRNGKDSDFLQRSDTRDSQWAALIGTEELNAGVVLLAVFVSIVAGAAHALSPGHGKTVVAAYLIGSRGTVWHAVFLGIIVTMTHVSSVLLLGLIALYFSQYVVPDRLYPWIESFSGLLIVLIGSSLFFRRFTAYQRKKILQCIGISSHREHFHDHPHDHSHDHPHDHSHDHPHVHSHDHSHDHEHGPHSHTHEIPAGASWWDLLVLGISGGMLPCPAAILVLLGAISLHRLWFGILLILFFSIGLAAVLITIGILMVTAKHWLDRILKSEESLAWLQIVSPVLVTLLGVILFLRGLQTGGYITFHF